MKYDSPVDQVRVLLTLLALVVHQLACRNLPSYLVTVPVPGCEEVCQGVLIEPLCELNVTTLPNAAPIGGRGDFAACHRCRARRESPAMIDVGSSPSSPSTGDSSSDSLGGVTFFQVSAAINHKSSRSLYDADGYVGEKLLVGVSAVQNATYYNIADGVCMRRWQYGLLVGYGFAAAFAAGLLPAAKVSSLKPRVTIIGVSTLVWSVTTGIQAGATEFMMLVALRAIEGVSQAFMLTAALSLLSDIFADGGHLRELALWVLNQGLFLGAACASFSIWFAILVGWRWANMIASLIGIALATYWTATVSEPQRQERDSGSDLLSVAEQVFARSRVVRLLTIAASAKMLAAFSLSAFLPLWFARAELTGFTSAGYAGWNAAILAAGCMGSALLSTLATYAWSCRDPDNKHYMSWIGWHGLVGAGVAIPLLCLMLLATSFAQAMICYFLLLILTETWYGPTVLALQASVRKSVSGRAVSLFHMAVLLASGLGPAIIGFCDPGTVQLRVHLLWLCITANVVAAGAFWWAGEEIRIDPVHPHSDDWLEQVQHSTLVM
mmetsp:Transcript_2477/g.5391  ORF Transcript_2477/g.5391 Transcript_2477/m.5391 type:complete len:551 (-) Transcript_2477:213-1865(-)